MEQDKLDALKAEYHKEREICSGANASEYHKKNLAELEKKLSITAKADTPKPLVMKEKPATVETTATTATEETTVSMKSTN